MCTAITYKTKDFYFGRTLDYEYSYNEKVTITPKYYDFKFRNINNISKHYAIIGMAFTVDNYPLYYDACNEKGLCMAGLNFVGNAKFKKVDENKINIASFEFIPYILSLCSNTYEAKKLIEKINITNIEFNEELKAAELHWIISDENHSITVESVENGIKIYDNSVGVLTNNPPFDYQLFNLNNFMSISKKPPTNNFSKNLKLDIYSRGLGGLGLPGDLSSQSRFIRASFVKENSISNKEEIESVNQFFHILSSVEQQRGCCEVQDEKYEITIYSSCCNANKGIYYYTTYNNHQINAINMHNENLEGKKLIEYPLILDEQINYQN